MDVFTEPKQATTKEFVSAIIRHDLPEDAIAHLTLNETWVEGANPIVRLTFKGNVTDEPVVASIIRKFDTDVSILFGGVDYIQDMSFGHLIVELKGERAKSEAAIDYLHNLPIGSEVIGYVTANH